MNKKPFKQKIAVIMAIILIFGVFLPPETVQAITSNEKNMVPEIYNTQEIQDGISIEGKNAFGNLIGKELTEKATEQTKNEGNNIFSVEMDGQTAKVSFETTEDATLVICIYNEDGEEMLISAINNVTVGQTETEIVIEESLPQYFYLRSFLINSETLRPLCTSYETPDYTQEMQEFLAKTTDDFNHEKVLNLDNDKTNNFAVYNDKTIIIPEKEDVNKITKADDEKLIYVIENADTDITSLQKGDIFSYKYNDGEVLVVKIASITKDGTTVTITGENISLEEVFDYVKIDTEAGTEDVTVDTSKMDEGLIYNGLVDDNNENRLRKKENKISQSLSYNFGKIESSSGNIEISGGLNIKLDMSFKVNMTLFYKYCEFKLDYSVKINAYVNGKIQPRKIPLGYIALDPIPGVGISFVPYFNVEASGKIELNGTLSGTTGAYASSETGLGNLTTTPQFFSEIKGEVTIFVGLGVDPGITIFHKKIDSLEIKAVAGGEIIAAISKTVANTSGKVHACKNCINGEIYGKAELSVNASFIDKNKFPNGINLTPKKKIRDFHYSFDFNEFELQPCSHYKFKIDVIVTDQKGKAIPGADIRSSFYINYQGQNHIVQKEGDFIKSDIITTDEKGAAFAYLTAGTYTLTAYAKNYATTKQTVVITDDVKSVRIVLKKLTTKPTASPSDKPTEQPTSSPSEDPGSISASDIVSVSLGKNHSGAITKDGSLYMWGDNSDGQLGVATVNNTEPVKVLDNVVSISLGDNHSGAITKDGSLYMWGSNHSWQVAGTNDGIARHDSPTKILDNVASISLKDNKSSAITKDGSLYMWGQLGNSYVSHVSKPVKLLDNVASISLGGGYDGAITKDGSLYMWGGNSFGQLGDGTNAAKIAKPVKILDNVASISLGGSHSGAVTKDGSLYMWGRNNSGELGDGTTESKTKPVKVLDNVASISLGGYHSGAVTKDGSLYMWGYNSHGQLGDGTTEDKTKPIKVLDNVISISLGSWHSSAITRNNNLYVWGDNTSGHLGDGTTVSKTKPVKVLDNVVSASLEEYHSGAVTKDGSMYMWGYNYYGQLGDGTGEDKTTPVKIFDNITITTSYRNLSLTNNSQPIHLRNSAINNMYIPGNADKPLKSAAIQPKSFTGLLPNECYNFYILKSHSVENLLSPDNLLYLKQYVSDSAGNINATYQLNGTSGYDEPFVVGMSRPDLSDAQIEIPDLIYTGTEQNIYPKVSYKGNELLEGEDYIVSGDFNVTEEGDYSVIISGTGLYTGEIIKSFKVKGTDTNIPEISPSPSIAPPDSNSPSPSPSIKPSVSHSPSPSPSKKPSGSGTGGNTGSGGGGASGGSSSGGTGGGGGAIITPTSTPVATLTPSPSPTINPTLTPVTTATTEPSQVTKPTLSPKPSASTNPGTGSDSIFNNNSKKEIISADVTLNKKSVIYNGKEKKPGVTVLNGSLELIKDKEYTVSYLYNINVGTAYVTVYGEGNYYGSVTKSFKIIPKGTPVKGKVKPKHKGFTVKWKKQPKSITGYQVQYSTSKNFKGKTTVIRTVKKKSITKLTAGKLKAKKKYYVRVRTYKTVKGKKYYSRWSKSKVVKTKK